MISMSMKLFQVPLMPSTKVLISSFVQPRCAVRLNITRTFKESARESFTRAAVRKAQMKEKLMAPSNGTAFDVGKGALLGGSCVGLGALCYYGLGLSDKPGALERSQIWPQLVRERIRATYMYFGGSIVLSAVSAVAALRSPVMLQFILSNSWKSFAAMMVALIGSGMVVQMMPYEKGLGIKQLAWMVHTATLGCTVAPLCFLGGPIVTQAAWYTAGIVGGLSTLAVCAPSETFLKLGGPLAIGLGVVFASSLGNMFLDPTTTKLGAGLYSVNIYGGLLLFSGFLLYDTQRIIKRAEEYPIDAPYPYDPINEAISIYLDTLQIFIRLAIILANSSGNEKKKK